MIPLRNALDRHKEATIGTVRLTLKPAPPPRRATLAGRCDQGESLTIGSRRSHPNFTRLYNQRKSPEVSAWPPGPPKRYIECTLFAVESGRTPQSTQIARTKCMAFDLRFNSTLGTLGLTQTAHNKCLAWNTWGLSYPMCTRTEGDWWLTLVGLAIELAPGPSAPEDRLG
jgi:hypothetical protein